MINHVGSVPQRKFNQEQVLVEHLEPEEIVEELCLLGVIGVEEVSEQRKTLKSLIRDKKKGARVKERSAIHSFFEDI